MLAMQEYILFVSSLITDYRKYSCDINHKIFFFTINMLKYGLISARRSAEITLMIYISILRIVCTVFDPMAEVL